MKNTKFPPSSVLFVVGAFLAFGAYAAEPPRRVWNDNSGDHRWSNLANWEKEDGGALNTGAPAYSVFPEGQDWTVVFDGGDPATTSYYLSIELPDGEGVVTLTNAAPVYVYPATGAFVKIGSGRELKIDGPTVRFNRETLETTNAINGTLRLSSGKFEMTSGTSTDGGRVDTNFHVFGGDAKLIVEGGVFGAPANASSPYGYLCLTNNATLTITGGIVQSQRWIFCSPDDPDASIERVRLMGGTLWNAYSYTFKMRFRDRAHLGFYGGRLIWGFDTSDSSNCLSSELGSDSSYEAGHYFSECLPPVGGELVVPTSSVSDNSALKFHVDGDYYVGGAIYTTNNSDVAAGNVYLRGNVSLRGGATIYANALRVNSGLTSVAVLDLDRLCLGMGGIRRTSTYGNLQICEFVDGIVFGAWGGDVPFSTSSAKSPTIRLSGPVVYDTQDCFDPSASRTIYQNYLVLDSASNTVSEIRAVGGGTVVLGLNERIKNELRTLEVADDTTLEFLSTNIQAELKTMNLKLGANARLKINLKKGDYVDAAATAEFGLGAKIVVTDLPAAMAAGMFYPVYSGPAGSNPDLSRFEYDGEAAWPDGWSFAKTGSAVYLTDGNPPAYSPVNSEEAKDYTRFWSGAGSDNLYTNVGNWVSKDSYQQGLLPYSTGGGCNIYFKGRRNTDIYVGYSGALTQRGWYFHENSGPYIFSGDDVVFQYPFDLSSNWGPTFWTRGNFPIVISNNLKKTATDFLWLASRKQGSISLMGAGCKHTSSGNYAAMLMAGDNRIGGAFTSEYVRVEANNPDKSVPDRTTRLTVMPGGALKVLRQSGDFNENGAGAFAVAAGGTIDIAGTELLLTSNNTHYVDGAMTVACPLVAQGGLQTFRGEGTLTLSGGVRGGGGIRVEGDGMTLVTGKVWDDVSLSFKDNVTVAPTEDWTFRGESLGLAHHSTLTFATGGHKVTLYRPIVSDNGALAVTGNGMLAFTRGGTKLRKVTLGDGATIALAGSLSSVMAWTDLMTVREDDPSIESSFAPGIRVFKHVDETGCTVYRVKGNPGMMIFVR